MKRIFLMTFAAGWLQPLTSRRQTGVNRYACNWPGLVETDSLPDYRIQNAHTTFSWLTPS